MTPTLKTKCPRCHTVYPMPKDKLNAPKARANCGKCGHTFFLNLNLVEAANPHNQAPTSSTSSHLTSDGRGQMDGLANKQAPTNTQSSKNSQAVANAQTATDTSAKTPTRKKKAPIITEGMIYDDMQTDEEDSSQISFDGLDDFLKQDTISAPITASSSHDTAQQNGSDDESWLDDLLKNDDSPDIATKQLSPQNNAQDEFADMFDEDYTDIIPIAHNPLADNPQLLAQKAEQRLAHNPTEEQKAKSRSLATQLGWLVGCAVLVGLLAVQYVFFNADNIAKHPDSAGPLLALCPLVKCPTDAVNLNAFDVSYDIKAGEADYSTDLLATFKNTSSSDQLYPNLKITIHGKDGVIGGLALAPKDYLSAESRLLAAAQDKQFLLTLDVDRQQVKSINIEPFY